MQVRNDYLCANHAALDQDVAVQLCCLEIRYFFKDMQQIALDKKSNLEYLEREVLYIQKKKKKKRNPQEFYNNFLTVLKYRHECRFTGRAAQVFTTIRVEWNETKGVAQANTTTL